MMEEGGRGREAAVSAIDCQPLVGTSFRNLRFPCPCLIFTPLHVPFPPLSRRIKQPALKLHGNKDTVCKPCHMAQLASVCGSDGHTYSSVVRNPDPGGVHPRPQGTEDYVASSKGSPEGSPVLMWDQKGSVSVASHRRDT